MFGCELVPLSSRQGPMADSCKHGNDTSRSLKGGEFLDQHEQPLCSDWGRGELYNSLLPMRNT